MKIINCEQDTPEWIAARLGIPTASEFHRVVTAVNGELSKSAEKYAYGLVAEALLRRPLEKQVNTWAMKRGKELEPAAASHYEFITDTEATRVGFVTTDDGLLGCSPDRLILAKRGGVEIKCPLDENHMAIWFDGPGDDFKQQVQGSLLVADELEWWDLYSHHPVLPTRPIRTLRDAPYQVKMRSALARFLEMRDRMLAKAIASGFFEERAAREAIAQSEPAADMSKLFGLDAVHAGVIVAAGKPSTVKRKPKLEPVVACRVAKAAARSAAQAAKPVPAPIAAAIAKAPPVPPPVERKPKQERGAKAAKPVPAPIAAAIAKAPPVPAPVERKPKQERGAKAAKPVPPPIAAAIAKAPPVPAPMPTARQAVLLAILTRPGGASRKDLLEASRSKGDATPAAVARLAELFGYRYEYHGRTASALTSYRLVRDSGAKGI